MNDKWKQDVEINPDALDCEWVKQASLFGEYCVAQAEARRQVDMMKEGLEVKAAGLGLKIRTSPAQYGLLKVTEDSVQAVILLDKDYANQWKKVQDAQFEYEVMVAAVRALDQKKSALENLVRLQGQNYFAGPSVPRDVGAEWIKDCERRSARDKIKEKMVPCAEANRVINRKGGQSKQ
jgi:hypothetical protein